MKRLRLSILLVFLPLAAASPDGAADAGPAMRGDARVGEALAGRWCNDCHLVGGAKRATDTAPPFAAIAKDPAKTVDHLRAFMSKPHAPMPPIPLSGTEVEDLIAYIRSLGR
jgi:mono/diheme cytochrome c family protein